MSLDLSKLERELSVAFPRPFIKAIETIAGTCTDWPVQYAAMGDQFFTDVDRLLELNLAFRAQPMKYVEQPKSLARSWPNELFVFSYNGRFACFFDTTKADPEIQTIYERKLQEKDHLTPRRYDNFRELARSITHGYKQIRKAVQESDHVSRMREQATRRRASKTECPDLVEEGWLLARPAQRLGASGDSYAAVWGGDGLVQPPSRGKWQHWITVDCSQLPLNPRGLTGVISTYEERGGTGRIKAFHDDRAALPQQPDGDKLYGSQFKCLPSVGVVLSKGSARVSRWLRGEGIWSGDAEGAHFEDNEQVDRYNREFQANHPFYVGDCDAMLGGWGVVFPDSKWRSLMNKSLLVTTFRDAEPWLEVYDSKGAFSCYARIT